MNITVGEVAGPIGLALDTNGDMWTGIYNGSALIKIDPRAKAIVETIALPAALITAVTFGGPELDTLFVTTAKLQVNFYTGVVGPPLGPPPASWQSVYDSRAER